MHHFHFGDVGPDADTSVVGDQVWAFRCCFGQGFIAASNNTLLRSQIHKHQITLNEKMLKCLKVVLWVLLSLHCEISFSSVLTFLYFVGYSFLAERHFCCLHTFLSNFAQNLWLIYCLNLMTVCFTKLRFLPTHFPRHFVFGFFSVYWVSSIACCFQFMYVSLLPNSF